MKQKPPTKCFNYFQWVVETKAKGCFCQQTTYLYNRAMFLMIIWRMCPLSLSYYFTKNRPFKIFKIEKMNRQAVCKNALI